MQVKVREEASGNTFLDKSAAPKMTKLAEYLAYKASTKGPSPRMPSRHNELRRKQKRPTMAEGEGQEVSAEEEVEVGEEWETEMEGDMEEQEDEFLPLDSDPGGGGAWDGEESVYDYIKRVHGVDVQDPEAKGDSRAEIEYRIVADLDKDGQVRSVHKTL